MTSLLTDIAEDFAHVRAWVFDLDNTLYPPQARLFDQIEARMRAWMMAALDVDAAEADRLRAAYWEQHGTTLAGLMAEHGLPADDFLVDVHDIDLSHLAAAPALARAITALPGRRIVYTNGSEPYARRVLAARGLSGVFDAVYGVEHAGLVPKPQRAAFEAVFALDGLAPEQGAMFEDDPRNLAVPHAMGMRTVLVGPPNVTLADHIHHHTDDLAGFVSQLSR
ncbi:pyrimidine 5'-nucleotidase [Limimaricola hongkongensis]|uniref:Pyridoxal-5'-phosphate phosphatase, Alphaproteobacterial type n=1 Tax=Limimaricola hongkongensis DSM 17492 TaxID=1122180 RepID=A0A017H9Q3_9RHOB|nr:pyrimidine 5'-nucleotidase [Limimaricola hongkongensis]EYD71086.1 Pyridoxal-5'-phosphate phosphatase, Alphaproteobacterial type [Limimaricola hongkongensis DSM 17492]